jgi:hypothetical protein
MSSTPADFGRSSKVMAIDFLLFWSPATARGKDTKVAKNAKEMKTTETALVAALTFVSFVPFVSFPCGTPHPPMRFFRTNVTLAGRSARRRMYQGYQYSP